MVNLALGHHVRQFLKGSLMSDDLYLKTHFPNHLASRTERQAAAGAKLPKNLNRQLAQLEHLTTIARPLLAGVLGVLSDEVWVAYAKHDKITLALPNMTAVNHVRYLQHECLLALRQDTAFENFVKLGLIVNPTLGRSHHDLNYQSTTQANLKKPLSENTVQTITQTAEIVIKNKNLQNAFIRLIQNAQIKE